MVCSDAYPNLLVEVGARLLTDAGWETFFYKNWTPFITGTAFDLTTVRSWKNLA